MGMPLYVFQTLMTFRRNQAWPEPGRFGSNPGTPSPASVTSSSGSWDSCEPKRPRPVFVEFCDSHEALGVSGSALHLPPLGDQVPNQASRRDLTYFDQRYIRPAQIDLSDLTKSERRGFATHRQRLPQASVGKDINVSTASSPRREGGRGAGSSRRRRSLLGGFSGRGASSALPTPVVLTVSGVNPRQKPICT
jgi:hypothetical protein